MPLRACCTSLFFLVLFAPLATPFGTSANGADRVEPKGLGEPGEFVRLTIDPGFEGRGVIVRGRDARQQLYVTAEFASGQLRDRSHDSTYSSQPEGIVEISAHGLVTPITDGDTIVTAISTDGQSSTLKVHVEGVKNQIPINFKNQIVPIFTKLACNSGGCHGKSSGQNGFKLSLLGFYPEDDYEFLVKEARGRRIFPSSPTESLLLTKPVGQSPHGGGKRMEADSYEYRLIARWIEQGMPYGSPEDPVVTEIECLPHGRVMNRSAEQQITVLAKYSDGTTEDVTRTALFEANDTEMAECSETGVVETFDLAGEVAIMARYQGQVATFRATIPLGADVSNIPASTNVVDTAVFNKLKVLGIPPSPVCDDGTFIRRVQLDITGTLPTDVQVTKFVTDTTANKRDMLIDQLLETREYADYFTNKWNLVLRNKKAGNQELSGTMSFHQWIWDSLYENKPYNTFVTEILTAQGNPDINPPAAWYREVDKVDEQVEDTAQLFLGLRIQCARCHHHPFEKWSQNDYYGLAAFFSRIGKKPIDGGIKNARDRNLFHNDGIASANNPRNKQNLKPTALGSGKAYEIPADRDPRRFLADWMSSPTNKFFAPSLVNRYWKHFFSRGIVEPEDDMRATNPPSNAELLDGLSKQFIASGFDLKDLIRTICRSKTYQLSSLPNEYNMRDKQNFSRFYPRRMSAEVLYDAFHQVTATTQNYSGLPGGTRAVQLPDPSTGPYFLKVFGQPQGETACECERSDEANLAQSLHLLNSSEVQNKIAHASGRAATLAAGQDVSNEDRIRELYRWVYSREPDGEELKLALGHIAKHEKDVKIAYEDILWALINTKEFLFNH